MRILAFILLTFNWFNITAQKNAEPYEKGEFRINLGLLFLNHVTIKPFDESRTSKHGYFGESLGVEYSLSDNSFIALNASLAETAQFSLRLPLSFKGPYKKLSTTHLSGSYYKIISRFVIGSGLNYSNILMNRGSRSFGDSLVPNYRDDRQNRAIGLIFHGFYRLGKTVNVGLMYRPTFYVLKPKEVFSYDHLLSLEFNWRFRLNNR